MAECNSHGTPNMYPNLSAPLSATLLNDQQQLTLNKSNETRDYFVGKIKERELVSKRLSKYMTFFGLF